MKGKVYKADTYRYTLGYDGRLRVNALRSLPDARFLLALKRLRKHVETAPFIPDDSNEVGNKYTHCSWGLCCDVKEVYPDKEDYIWPEEDAIAGYVSPLHRGDNQVCPHDMRKKGDLNGCFYKCAYKRHLETGSTKADRREALRRIDSRISEWESKQ